MYVKTQNALRHIIGLPLPRSNGPGGVDTYLDQLLISFVANTKLAVQGEDRPCSLDVKFKGAGLWWEVFYFQGQGEFPRDLERE